MKTQLIIPNKIKVGFNEREDTYTGMLGYIIYHDGKTWRKETSWEGWREKFIDEETWEQEKQKYYQQTLENYKSSKYTEEQINKYLGSYENYRYKKHGYSTNPKIEPVEFENVPTEGFVLNKKVGGYKSDWNVRETKARVFDPRGFEFEIDIPNLLYILQETNSIKGKGLEGEFVYSWDGKELVLLPTCSPDYQSCMNFTKIQGNKVSAKSLIPGASYMTKKEENYIYLGRLNWYPFNYVKIKEENGDIDRYSVKTSSEEKFHMFVDKNEKLQILASLTTISNVISDAPVDNYAELIENFKKQKFAHKIVGLEPVTKEMVIPEIDQATHYNQSTGIEGYWFEKLGENHYLKYTVYRNVDNSYNHKLKKYEHKALGFTLYHDFEVKFENGKVIQTSVKNIIKNNSYGSSYGERPTSRCNGIEELLNMNLFDLKIKLENGDEYDYKTYTGGY